MSWVKRRAGPLIIVGTSALGGAAYRFLRPEDLSNVSLNPHLFTSYALVDKQPVSSTSAIFVLRNVNGASDSESVKEVWKRSVWSVQIKQPQLQIARAYTPLPPALNGKKSREGAPQDVRLLIRQEDGGEVSTYLHGLPEQSTIELRGPNVECELPHNIKDVIFLAGGTGIAPAMQVAQALGRRTGSAMHILWANRRREECIGGISDDRGDSSAQSRIGWWKSFLGSSDPSAQTTLDAHDSNNSKGPIVQELDAFKERSQNVTRGLSVQYYVDEENTSIQPDDIVRKMRRSQDETGSKLIVVSGPDGFIEYWAGKKLWVEGREVQGPLGGQLGRMDLGKWKVLKL